MNDDVRGGVPNELAKPSRRVRFTLVSVSTYLSLLVAVGGVVLRFVHTNWQPALVGAAFSVQLSAFGIIALLLAGAARKWIYVAVSLVVIGAAVAVQAPLFIGSTAPHGGDRVIVMQSNLRLGEADAASIVARVTRSGVDVLTTEELTPEEVGRLRAAGLGAKLPYQYLQPRSQASGVGIWSRYPLVSGRSYPGFELQVLSARVRLPSGRQLVVFAVHLVAPYPPSPTVWHADLKLLHTLITSAARDPDPLIASGDYNGTVDQADFRALLTDGIHDAATQAGAGFLPTYPSDRWFPPQIAIDHLLVARATAERVRSMTISGSDHRCLVAELRV